MGTVMRDFIPMSKEEWKTYFDQIESSGGFEARAFRGCAPWEEPVYGLIVPLGPDFGESTLADLTKYAKHALHKCQPSLVFEEIVDANFSLLFNHYITFQARDPATNVITTYQTLAELQLPNPHDNILIRIFREKQSLDKSQGFEVGEACTALTSCDQRIDAVTKYAKHALSSCLPDHELVNIFYVNYQSYSPLKCYIFFRAKHPERGTIAIETQVEFKSAGPNDIDNLHINLFMQKPQPRLRFH